MVDKTRHYYTLCNAAPPVDTPPIPGSPISTNQTWSTEYNQNSAKDDGFAEEDKYWEEEFEVKEDDENEEVGSYDDAESKSNDTIINTLEDKPRKGSDEESAEETINSKQDNMNSSPEMKDSEKKTKDDQGIMHDSPSGLHYRAGDEPEPIDLTRLNIEAAMMCLASKVRLISGKSDSPSMSSRTFRFKEVDSRASSNKSSASETPCKSETDKNSTILNTSISTIVAKTPKREIGNLEDPVYQWANELRPSMRKLRQGMDSLCKTARLICRYLNKPDIIIIQNISKK